MGIIKLFNIFVCKLVVLIVFCKSTIMPRRQDNHNTGHRQETQVRQDRQYGQDGQDGQNGLDGHLNLIFQVTR